MGELEERRKKMLKLSAISLQAMDFRCDTIFSARVFTLFMERKFPKQGFFQK